MTTQADKRQTKNSVIPPKHGDEKSHADDDGAVLRRAQTWILIGDLVILGISLMTLVAISEIAQGRWHSVSAPRVSQAKLLRVQPVIRAWHPWEETPAPVGWPGNDAQRRNGPPAAILWPTGIEVVERIHRDEHEAPMAFNAAPNGDGELSNADVLKLLASKKQRTTREKERRMRTNKRILVAVDRSVASRRAVRYVADMLGGKPDFHVGLLHLELPPRMLEWGGSEDTATEEKVSSARAVAYKEMEEKAIENGRDLLKDWQGLLAQNGIDVAAQMVQFEEPLDPKNIARHILKTAAERQYGTVVVGQHAFSGLKHLFQHHVGEELVRVGMGVAIWIIE